MEDMPLKNLPDIPFWSENYALACLDAAKGVGVWLHIGRWHKDMQMWRELVTVLLPDGTVIASRSIGDARASDANPGGSSLAVHILEDGRRQTWSFHGVARRVPVSETKDRLLSDGPLKRLEFNLLFDSSMPVWSLGGGKESGFAGHGHVEQIGRLTGEIRLENESWTIDTFANRDHSRGPRRTDALARHVWFHGVLSDGRCFQAYEAQEGSAAQTTFSESTVFVDGVMKKGRLQIDFQIPMIGGLELIHKEVPFRIDYEGGAIRGKVSRFATTMHHQFTYPWDTYLGARQIGAEGNRRMVEQGVIYAIEDGVTGYGHMERTIPGRLLTDDEIDAPY